MSIEYGLYNCWWCLCEVCTRMHCPWVFRRTKLGFCVTMIQRDKCPIVKCDYFQHRQKHKVYRIIRRHKKYDIILERLDEIQARLDKLAGELENIST